MAGYLWGLQCAGGGVGGGGLITVSRHSEKRVEGVNN